MFPVGIRLNNPGNLRPTSDQWLGEARLQDNKKLVRFLTPYDGVRAMMKTLLTYEDLYRITTVRLIIERYAPPSENNTEAYISDVAERLHRPANLFIDLSRIENLIDLAKAMVGHEQGNPPDGFPIHWYDESVYHSAAVAALESVGE